MARPNKKGIDYFPVDCKMDDKIYMIEVDLGTEGFGLFIKLLMKIYSENYYIDWNERKAKIFARQNNVDINLINSLINICLNEDLFSKKLYKKYKILTSNGIQKRYFYSVKDRKNIEVIEEYLVNGIKNYIEKIDNVTINSINPQINPVNLPDNTHTIVKESIVKEKIEYIYNRWNEQKIIVHKNIDNYRAAIKAALNKYDDGEIGQAIVNYDIILKGKEYYFDYKWTLSDFLKRGIDKFLDLEIAKSNYKNKGDKNGKGNRYNKPDNPGSKGSEIDKYKHLEEIIQN